jgi:acetyl esterase/lipase
VLAVNYRMASEYHFPAASKDIASVYVELLKQYRAEDIRIYGCSAGGALTAQAVAWLQKETLPTPGAIGIFGAGTYEHMTPSSLAKLASSGQRWLAKRPCHSIKPPLPCS